MIVVFLDVRGFTSFAGIAESTDTAEFLKSIYIKILDDYFPDAVFFKPTGDGLLVLLDYDKTGLRESVRSAVERSINLVEAFPRLCDDDEMVNFKVPSKIGIGLARGSATSLTAKGKALDYSGRPLNLASRLMDLARPSGVVFDDSFGFKLLTKKLQGRFDKDAAYVKGIAESTPMDVYLLKGFSQIPESNRKPLDGFIRFTEDTEEVTFKVLEDRKDYLHPLSMEPARKDSLEVHLEYPVIQSGRRHPTLEQVATLPATYQSTAGASYAGVDYRPMIARLKGFGIKPNWPIRVTVEYSVAADTGEVFSSD